jgi:hypothetical protein
MPKTNEITGSIDAPYIDYSGIIRINTIGFLLDGAVCYENVAFKCSYCGEMKTVKAPFPYEKFDHELTEAGLWHPWLNYHGYDEGSDEGFGCCTVSKIACIKKECRDKLREHFNSRSSCEKCKGKL